MPEIIRFGNCKICVYAGDHLPPLYHIRGPGWTVTVGLGSLSVLKGRGPKSEIEGAMAWAMLPANLDLLARWWSYLNERD